MRIRRNHQQGRSRRGRVGEGLCSCRFSCAQHHVDLVQAIEAGLAVGAQRERQSAAPSTLMNSRDTHVQVRGDRTGVNPVVLIVGRLRLRRLLRRWRLRAETSSFGPVRTQLEDRAARQARPLALARGQISAADHLRHSGVVDPQKSRSLFDGHPIASPI
jgi:hypothetical protein